MLALLAIFTALEARADLRTEILRKRALENGILSPSLMIGKIDKARSKLGRELFKDVRLSINGEISCETCHQDQFSSADGLPNAIGVGGKGFGFERLKSNGAIVPRNTLPLWGRGSKGFDTFFWGGKVAFQKGNVTSQFGNNPPSLSPLEVSVHLPMVEFREMVSETKEAERFRTETSASANKIYAELLRRIKGDTVLVTKFVSAYSVEKNEIQFSMITTAIAEFIRDRFRIVETKFHRFVFKNGTLSRQEIEGGLLFYGKGRCSACHSGSMFSDNKFYTIPFPAIGFGKNGFGQDFGRYNITFNPTDLYAFRTPPLFNVVKTKPYFHSGSVPTISSAITAHFDPLGATTFPTDPKIKAVWYEMFKAWSSNPFSVPFLDTDEVNALEAFLKTLSFPDIHAKK